jgi:hypothetical protein
MEFQPGAFKTGGTDWIGKTGGQISDAP